MTNMAFPNSRMSSIQMSGGIREILGRADELENQGRNIIHMEIGRPDFDSPQCAKNAAITALNNGDVHYTDMAGTHKLREAVADKYLKDNSMQIDPDKNIVITSGAIEALTAAFLTMLEPGDEVIVPAPYFPAYADQIALANGVLVKAHTTIENEFRLKVADLENSISNKSKVLLLNTPNNPSGAVLTRQDLEEIASLAIKHNLWVISDECYEKFLYEGDHISIASLPGMAERTVTISAASKTWSMTGWRVGWIVCPEQMRPFANKCHQNLTTCATSFAQAGVTEAFKHADKDKIPAAPAFPHPYVPEAPQATVPPPAPFDSDYPEFRLPVEQKPPAAAAPAYHPVAPPVQPAAAPRRAAPLPASPLDVEPEIPQEKKRSPWLVALLVVIGILLIFCVIPWLIIEFTDSYCTLFPGFFNAIQAGACP